MRIYEEDIIAAIATPVGDGAISIVRLSGKNSISLVDKFFRGIITLKHAQPNSINYGKIIDINGSTVDEVLAAVFKAPKSYTAEDMVEINCHGGWYITNKILEIFLKAGARLAEPGEFTKRAFLNGRIDLTQAEAIADLIQSKSDLARKTSIEQLQGNLSKKINEISKKIIDLLGIIELELDFVEENIVLKEHSTLLDEINKISNEILELIKSFGIGKFYREGVKLIIIGKPNSGKSSLLNTLLNENRAIVTPIPGTTRDLIEENLVINGALFKIVDTAGLRHSEDIIEMEGIRRTYEKVENCDLILYIIDVTTNNFNEDIEFIHTLSKYQKKIILVFNKIDLNFDRSSLEIFKKFTSYPQLEISALKHINIQTLFNEIFNSIFWASSLDSQTSIFITNERHKQALTKSYEALKIAESSASKMMSGEFIALDLRNALNALESITGKITTDEILNNIFSKFCIGK